MVKNKIIYSVIVEYRCVKGINHQKDKQINLLLKRADASGYSFLNDTRDLVRYFKRENSALAAVKRLKNVKGIKVKISKFEDIYGDFI